MADFLLHPPAGSRHKQKRKGRGASSGLGTTAGRGNKGQQARSGGGLPYVGFEGGQMPLYRRVARRGFSNYPFRKEFEIFNLSDIDAKFQSGETVDRATLIEKKLLKKKGALIKILGNGDLGDKKITFSVDKVSKSAKEKIEKSGGKVAEIGE